MKNWRTKLLIFLFLPGTFLWAQTMHDLPRMVLAPITEISNQAKEENLGETLRTIFRTAFDRSLVFMVPDTGSITNYTPAGLKGEFSPRAPRKVFLLEASCLKIEEEIQVDLRIIDVFTGSLLNTFYIKVDKFNQIRNSIIQLVGAIEISLFRDTLSTLKLTTVPSLCDIYLDGRYMGKTDVMEEGLILDNLIPGTYQLRVLAPGYMDYEETLNLRPRHITNFSANLSLEPGILVIDSLPQGAEITIDGKPAGTTPRKFDEIEPGVYNIILRADNYNPWENRLLIESRQEKNISATLEIMPGSLNLVTKPPGVEVISNSISIGQTPLIEYNLEPGKYILEFKLNDYATETVSAVINPGRETKYELEMKKQQGQVTFLSTPPGVDIYITGGTQIKQLIGQTPLDKFTLEVGYYDVLYEKPGYFREESSVICTSEEIAFVEQEMIYIPGSIRITTNPVQANIYIDNVYKGISPVEILQLQPGTYQIEARTAYGTEIEDVTVEPDEVNEIFLHVKKPALGYLSGIIITAISLLTYLSVLGE